MAEESTFWHDLVIVLVSAAAMIANTYGIILLRKFRSRQQNNQVFLLLSISVADLALAACWLYDSILCMNGIPLLSRLRLTMRAIRIGTYLTWFAIMYIFVVDRFLGINFPLQHQQLKTHQRMRLAVTVAWVFGGLNGITYCLIDMSKVRIIFDAYIWITLDVIYLILITITYASIFFAAYRTKTTQNNAIPRDTTSNKRQFFKIITIILLAFILLETIPTIFYSVLAFVAPHGIGYQILSDTVQPLYAANLLADPLIYIFLQPRVKTLLYQMIRNLCTRKHHVHSFTGATLCRTVTTVV